MAAAPDGSAAQGDWARKIINLEHDYNALAEQQVGLAGCTPWKITVAE